MESKRLKEISKSLSYVLRHRPDTLGLELEPDGWISVDVLIAAFHKSGKHFTHDILAKIVTQNDKQRFEFSDDGVQIRARQGHSVEVELGYAPAVPPALLYHGTATCYLDSIWEKGLIKGQRHHVHLSTNQQTMLQVGMRHGTPVVLEIQAGQMHADGHEFFVTGNSVWLTDHVPTKYLALNQEPMP